MGSDDVIRPAFDHLPVFVRRHISNYGHKCIGTTAEVHHCVAIHQVSAQQPSCVSELICFGEMPAIAAVPA